MAFPNWRQAVQEQAAMPPAPILEPKTTPAPVVVQSTPEPVKVGPVAKAAPQIAMPVAKKIEAKKPAAKAKTAPTGTKPAVLKKTVAKKTAAKAKPVAKKPAKSRRK
jgi:hypothetical protein